MSKEVKTTTKGQETAVAGVVEGMYVEVADINTEKRLASEIVKLTEQTKQMVLIGSIEIGRRLTEAKALIKHGQWGKWLEERVNYSQRTANNFMKIYKQYGESGLAEKSQSIANLSYTQALALLEVPEGERQKFAEENNAKDMTIKELQDKIKSLTSARTAAEERLAESEKKYQQLISDKDKAKEKASAEAEKLSGYIRVLEQQAKEAESNKQKEIKEKLDESIKKGKAKLKAIEEEKAQLQKEIAALQKQQQQAVDKAVKEEKAKAKEALAKQSKEIEEIKRKMQEQLQKSSDEMTEVNARLKEEQAKNGLAEELVKSKYLVEKILDSYAEFADVIMRLQKRNSKEAEALLKDLDNSMEMIRKKAKFKVVAS